MIRALLFCFAFATCCAGGVAFAQETNDMKPLPLTEKLRSNDWPQDEVDSLAVWRKEGHTPLLFVTAKKGDMVYVLHAESGEMLRLMGGTGDELGDLDRPNGVAVADDFLYVVERNNQRVQVFALPSLEPILVFGADDLHWPYGIAIHRDQGVHNLYITDDYDVGASGAPSHYGGRVKQYRVTPDGDSLKVETVRQFGDREGDGRLSVVESIEVDAPNDSVLICDEEDQSVKVYSLNGQYKGRKIGKGIIQDDPEGLGVIPGKDARSGWIVVSDQGKDITRLRVFTRDGSRQVAVFTGSPLLSNTDGITLYNKPYGQFERGALFAIHDDFRVQGYDIGEILKVVE